VSVGTAIVLLAGDIIIVLGIWAGHVLDHWLRRRHR